VDRSAYVQHYQLDQKHFWRISKRKLVLEWMDRYLPPARGCKVLDIGGACSLISQQLARFGEVTVVEPDRESVQLARSELGVNAIVGSLPHGVNLPGPFDVITLLDVLEHVDEELESLRTIKRLLNEHGTLVLTVPAYQWLWSEHDSALHHRRRYSKARLRKSLDLSGFDVARISYYTSFLLPMVVLQRLGSRLRRSSAEPTYRVRVPNRMVNCALGAVMSLERWLLRHVNLPCGSSLIAIAVKR
jgi:SAM-dependent methyltransferase